MSAPDPVSLTLVPRGTLRPVREVYDQHGRLDRLCRDLEAIADDLPKACPERCGRAAAELETFVPAHHAFEAGVFAEALAGEDAALLKRIADQHVEDEGLAFEIALALEPVAAGMPPEQPETLGYMLRAFFNNCRRSMLIEELALQAAMPTTRLSVVPASGEGGR